MTCQTVPPMLSRFLDRELSAQQAAEVEAHLALCEKCRMLREHWRLQGLLLRNHLSRHALGEDFVSGVLRRASSSAGAPLRASEFSSKRSRLLRWLPAAAAIVVAVFLTFQFFKVGQGVGYARVIDPGQSLEVMPSSSTVWMRSAAGELLRPGDWLRNSRMGASKILWHDTCNLTLEPGTLARFPAVAETGQLLLFGGELLSEVSASGHDFQVQTPAGSVSASTGRFDVRVSDLMLPDLAVGADQSETITGMVVSIGVVRVHKGDVTVESEGQPHAVVAGQTATFSGSGAADLATEGTSVRAALRQVPHEPGRGSLSSALKSTEAGLVLQLDAANISLASLLELTTALPVKGGDDLFVAGSLTIPVNAKAESIAAAAGRALALPVRCLQATAHLPVATIPQQAPMESVSDAEFRLQMSGNKSVSFTFRNVPAERAFQILRTVAADIPALSPESGLIPVTLEASGMEPAAVAAWLGRALGLNIGFADRQLDFIEVGEPEDVSPAHPGLDTAAPESRLNPSDRLKGDGASKQDGTSVPPLGEGGPDTSIEEATHAAGTVTAPADGFRPSWGVLRGTVYGLGFFPSAAPITAGSSTVTGNATAKTREYFGSDDSSADLKPSFHLVWPVLDEEEVAGGGAAYVLTNPTGLAAHTLWNGYDREGRLLAQFSLFVERNAAESLIPAVSFGTGLSAGGHWETVCNIALIGSRDDVASGASAPGMPVGAELLSHEASFPGWWLSRLGARIWAANPSASEAVVELQVMRFGEPVWEVDVTIPAHGGFVLPDPGFGISIPVGYENGMTIVVRVRQGSAAVGLCM